MRVENGYIKCDKCGRLMYDRTRYTTVKRLKTVNADDYYTKQIAVGQPLHFHDACLSKMLKEAKVS